jgi:hypothetical protein
LGWLATSVTTAKTSAGGRAMSTPVSILICTRRCYAASGPFGRLELKALRIRRPVGV